MKKVIPGLICLLLITTCGFEMPESITVKWNPGLYVPLGSPFAGMEPEDRLENLISPDNIRKMMNSGASGTEGMEIYEVSEGMAENHGIDKNVLTYLVEYQLADMPLDMEKYMEQVTEALNNKEEDIKIPSIPGLASEALPAGQYYYIYDNGKSNGPTPDDNKPFLKIPLNDMAKLVTQVRRNNGKFGLKVSVAPQLPGSANLEQLRQYLELKIPALGITDYTEGTIIGDELQFVNQSSTPFNPKTDLKKTGNDYELWIYARINGYCSGTIEPGMVFEWTAVDINTKEADGGNALNQEYPIENMLGDFLGGAVSFKEVSGYVYMTGMTEANMIGNIDMTVTIGGDEQKRNLKDAIPTFTVTTKPDGSKIADGSLTTSSFTGNTSPLNLASVFEGTGEKILKVNIEIPKVTITNSQNLGDSKIQSKLYALIPLDLKVSEDPSKPGTQAPDVDVGGVNIKSTYVPLDLGDALNKDSTESDLFGREENEDNFLNYITYVKIGITKTNINIIDPGKLAVLVKTKKDNRLLEFKDNAFLQFTGDVLNEIPFSPEFSVLLKKDDKAAGGKEDFGSFKILRPKNPSFDFNLYVEAKVELDYTVDF